MRLFAASTSSDVLAFARVSKLRCTGKSFVQFVLFHIVLQSSVIRNNQEVDIPLWGAPLILSSAQCFGALNLNLLLSIVATACTVWCDSHLA